MYRATSVHGSLADSKTNENFSKILKNLVNFVKGRKKSKKVKNMKKLWKNHIFVIQEASAELVQGLYMATIVHGILAESPKKNEKF